MFTKAKRNFLLFVVIPLLTVGLVPITNATPPTGPVTIDTEIDFSVFPFIGIFDVVEGAGILGCSSGHFEDIFRGFGAIEKVFTCDFGGNGSFTFLFKPNASPGPGDGNGHWQAWKATGDFYGLRGRGDFSVFFTGPDTAMEMLSGVIHYDPQ